LEYTEKSLEKRFQDANQRNHSGEGIIAIPTSSAQKFSSLSNRQNNNVISYQKSL